MKAGIIKVAGKSPVYGDFNEPVPAEGQGLIPSHRNCELSGSTPIQLPDRFRSSLSVVLYVRRAGRWGCVYSQSIYTGKLAKGL
jgi:hypothetical protein